jgi:very-short-patch-repair endonuclease
MVSRFPDFLICFDGKWGILEVDGQKYHQGRATEDHERSRIMERHGGIAYLTRFDYQRCMNDPDGVVKDFIEVLRQK